MLRGTNWVTRRESLRVAASALAAPALAQKQAPPNIIVLVADDLSAPYLGCYGDPSVRTPNLDRLAAEGMRFNRAYVTSPQCSPSRSSVFTGRSPHATGCSRLHAPLRADQQTFLELLRSNGYFAGAYRKHHMGADFARRLDFYGDAREPFSSFFEKASGKPFFLWAGFTQPHRPYREGMKNPRQDQATVRVPAFLPDTSGIRKDLALHYDAINELDSLCGEVLDLLENTGQADNTVVVFLGDNGMPYPRAKATLYQAGVRVPLIVRWPGKVKKGAVSDDLVSTIDLAATFADIAGTGSLDRSEGQSLQPLLTGRDGRYHRDYVFTERNWHDTWDPMRGVVSRRYSLICNYRPEVSYRGTLDHISASWVAGGGPAWDEIAAAQKAGKLPAPLRSLFTKPRPLLEIYDLEEDPNEFENLAQRKEMRGTIEDLQQALAKWMEETNDFLPPPVLPTRRLQPATTQPLRELLDGYLPS
jgi:arylsulfatase A-like enzyme